MIFEKKISRIFIILLIVFFAVTACSALLGYFELYRPVWAFLSTTLVVLAIYPFIIKRLEMPEDEKTAESSLWLKTALWVVGWLLLGVLILYPIARYPLSHVGDWFPWDAGAYHFPKAVEFFRSGSIWDMTISYADYPFGYESLLSFSMLLTGDLSLLGLVHVLIVLFFVSAFWMLARQVTRLQGGLLFLLIVLLVLSDHFFQFLNLWRVFTADIYTVGKNDILVAACILTSLFYFLKMQESYQSGMLGFALATGLAVSVKPNTLYVLFPLWLFVLVRFYKKHLASLFAHGLLALPGFAWLLRNILALGTFAGTDASRLTDWSIAANLTNPNFYQNIPKNLLIAVGIVLLEVVLAFVNKKEHYWNAILALVLFVAFISTPVTAYFGDTQTLPSINWRFGEGLLAFLGILLLNDIRLGVQCVQPGEKILRIAKYVLALGMVIASGWLVVDQRAMLESVPENAVILHDQFREPVGVDGYYSAYDYVQRNAHDAVVWVENGLPFYAYDAEFSNSITRSIPADYVVGFLTDWNKSGEGGFTSYFEEILQSEDFETVYQDDEGIVLKRK